MCSFSAYKPGRRSVAVGTLQLRKISTLVLDLSRAVSCIVDKLCTYVPTVHVFFGNDGMRYIICTLLSDLSLDPGFVHVPWTRRSRQVIKRLYLVESHRVLIRVREFVCDSATSCIISYQAARLAVYMYEDAQHAETRIRYQQLSSGCLALAVAIFQIYRSCIRLGIQLLR